MRVVCVCEYDGTNYCGWQSQSTDLQNGAKVSIQHVVEKALSIVYRDNITVFAASRTDSGVHAKNQVFHYDTDIDIDTRKLDYVINNLLPKDIRIKSAFVASDDFHARFCAKEKTYEYYINTGEYNVFEANYAFQYCRALKLDLIESSLNEFIGTMNFRALMSSGSDKIDCTRTIKSIKVLSNNADIVKIEITGDGFLYHMIRNIIGSFVRLSEGKIDVNDIKKGIQNFDRSTFKLTAPACGLYLKEICY